ncbi:hypothetical protein [Microcoleus sp. herbarium14]|uniref:hypothetical protein n=1 Tax=Microcoleus sp. herbarium14 TaxID=3055439 RepID=UPI002FCF107E
MPIAQAKKLLELPDSGLEDLLNCLVSLAKDCGHIEAMQKIGYQDSVSAAENLLEIQVYLDKIKNQIIYLLR